MGSGKCQGVHRCPCRPLSVALEKRLRAHDFPSFGSSHTEPVLCAWDFARCFQYLVEASPGTARGVRTRTASTAQLRKLSLKLARPKSQGGMVAEHTLEARQPEG